ncbi:MAG: sulfatase, partial [Cyclobacteriaceae bacterium]
MTPCANAQGKYIEQRIDYLHGNATEIYMVWGIDGWKTIPSGFLTAGTVVSEGKLHTKMNRTERGFSTIIKVPEGSQLNLMFWIARNSDGDVTDKWDTGPGKGYKFKSGIDPIVVYAPVNESWPLRGLLKSRTVWVIIILLAITFVLRKSFVRKIRLPQTAFITLAGIAIYGIVLYLRWRQNGASTGIADAMASTLYDGILILAISGSFLCLGILIKSRRRLLSVTFSIIALLSLIASVLNYEIIRKLGQPLNYQWLYYSDFLGSTEAQTAILANLSFGGFVRTAGLIVIFALLIYLFVLLYSLVSERINVRLIPAGLLALVVIPLAGRMLSSNNLTTIQQANPIIYFVNSCWSDTSNSNLFTMSAAPISLTADSNPDPLTESPVKNVILVVLESAAAEYFDMYGGDYSISPNLAAASDYSVLFENMYAHAPATNKSMISLLCSIYPWISYNTLTMETPEFSQPSISDEFKKAGFRTSFFTSSNLHFQNAEKFVKSRGFDKVSHYSDIPCDEEFKMEGFGDGYGIGVDDLCLDDELFRWVDQIPGERFFSVLWTNQAHYPYFFSGEEKDYNVDNIYFNRYLNILAHYDRLIGSIIESLRSRDLLDSTLIAIVGDHGEAFGQHNQQGHGHHVYEENLHVPMIMINPALFSGDRIETVSGHTDLPPTLLYLAGIRSPSDWQGRNMLSGEHPDRTFYFTPWSDYLF